MNTALGISSEQFGLLAGIFFWGYFLLEIPSNLLLHRIGARIWIARILISWGIVAMVSGMVHSVTQLYVARFLLGAMEAGFFPGIIMYLTYWFRQRDQAHVISLFVLAIPLASIVGAPVSGLILDHAHWMSISSWRWLLIVEGFPAIVCGLLTYYFLPNRPAAATFLNAPERDWITSELAREERQKLGEGSTSALRTLADARVWRLALAGFAFDIALYAMSFYMPKAVKAISRDYSNTTVGILVMNPHIAGLLTMILVARSSDRTQERRYHAAIPAVVAGAAMMSLSAASSPVISLALWSFAAMGIYSFFGPFFSLPSEFLAGSSAASGIALINSIAALGGFVGPSVIGALAGATGGIYRGIAVAGVSLCAAAVTLLTSRRRDRQEFTTTLSSAASHPREH